MTHDTPQDIIDALDVLLETERQHLLSGNLEALSALLSQKEELIDAMNAMDSAKLELLSGVQKKVVRNQALLSSALEGIRAVAERVASLRQVRKSLETYDESGRKKTYETCTDTSVEKRA